MELSIEHVVASLQPEVCCSFDTANDVINHARELEAIEDHNDLLRY